MNYMWHLMIYFGIYGVLALSLNILVGACGLLTLAHAGYFALGAYTYAITTVAFGVDTMTAIGLSVGMAALFSLMISLPTWRLKGDYFVIASIAIQVLIYSAIYNWVESNAPLGTADNMTNGPFGISSIPRPNIFGFHLDTMPKVTLITLLVLGAVAWMNKKLLFSPWGRVLNAMRDDELAARSIGKNVQFYKVEAVFIACVLAGFAGALYSGYVSYIDPTLATMDQSILFLSMVLVGGTGNVRGPLTGALLLLVIPEILRMLQIPDNIAAEARIMLYGLLLIIMVHVRPKGLLGNYRLD